MRGINNRLQAEKALLQTAVQACEVASASISRPGTPIREDGSEDAGAAPAREVGIKLRLEELIDLVEGRMTELGSQVTEVEGARRTKEALDAWIANQENVVAEMLKRPAKLRADAAQLEINMVTDYI